MIKKLVIALVAIVIVLNLTVFSLPDKPKTPGKFVEVQGKRIHYVETPGKGTPVVLIHGMPGTYLDFEKVTPRLQGMRTIAIDRPGYGWSEGGELDYQQQIEAVHELLGKLGVKRAIFVGHSFGGTLSLGVARKHPEDVKQLVLVAPGAGRHKVPALRTGQAYFIKFSHLPVIEQVNDLVFTNIALRISAGLGAAQAFSPADADETFKDRLLAVTMTDGNLDAMANDATDYNGSTGPWLDANVPLIKRPSVQISGRDDELVGYEHARILDQQMTNGNRLITVNGGHMLPYTHAALIAREVRKAQR